MRKFTLMLLLAVVSNNAMAAWVGVSYTDQKTTYANSETIRRVGDKVTMWVMDDHKTARQTEDGKGFLSLKALCEFDCKKEQIRQMAETTYSGNMGSGEVVSHVYVPDPDKWYPINPDSIDELLFKYACSKK